MSWTSLNVNDIANDFFKNLTFSSGLIIPFTASRSTDSLLLKQLTKLRNTAMTVEYMTTGNTGTLYKELFVDNKYPQIIICITDWVTVHQIISLFS